MPDYGKKVLITNKVTTNFFPTPITPLATTLSTSSTADSKLKNPNVSTVILGASRLSQLKDNLSAVNTLEKLTPEVLERIESIVDNKPATAERFGQ